MQHKPPVLFTLMAFFFFVFCFFSPLRAGKTQSNDNLSRDPSVTR